MTYEYLVWYLPLEEKKHQKSFLATLESVQTKAIRIITRAYKATSGLALDIEVRILLFKIQLEMLIKKNLLKLATSIKYSYIT